jgi:hypothetical protein
MRHYASHIVGYRCDSLRCLRFWRQVVRSGLHKYLNRMQPSLRSPTRLSWSRPSRHLERNSDAFLQRALLPDLATFRT